MFAVMTSSGVAQSLGYAAPNPSPSSWVSRRQPQPTADIKRRVTIYRDSLDTPWGFRLQGGKDFNTPLSVKRVFSGSPAVGQLTRDDLILAINEEPVDGLFHADVLEKIKSAGNTIVLNIQTSALGSEFGYASQDHFQPIQGTSHQQQPLYTPEEPTLGLQYESHQTPSASSYDTSPTTYETSPTTYETSPTTYETSPTTYETPPTTYETSDPSLNRTTSNAYNPKIATHQSRHRSAKRFQNAPTMPSGLSEPGWVPRPKSVPRNLPLSTPQQPLPSSQYRSPPVKVDDQLVQYPSTRDFWSASGAGSGSGMPAWYGSLRSARAPHSWESQAAKVQIQSEQESSDAWKEPEQPQQTHLRHAGKQQVEPQQVQPEPNRTFKAEIRGLILARPAHPQSTPEWEAASEQRIYRSQEYTHSAPETPVADTTVHAEVKNLTSYQDIHTPRSANDTQQAVDSPPVKLQPSLLFGDRSGRGLQQPSSQSRVIRAQPQATKTTVSGVHTRQEVLDTAPKRVAQLVSPPTIVPVHQVVTASQPNPQVHPIIQLKSSEAVAKPFVQNQVHPSKEQPSNIKVAAQPAKLTYLPETVERFNPVPEPKATAAGKHLQPVPERLTKSPSVPVERFNPGPNRSEQLPQTKHVAVPQTLGKLSNVPVERFNPGPERQSQSSQTKVKHAAVPQTLGKISNVPVERFNPGPERQSQSSQTKVKHAAVPQTLGKISNMPVERFNPGPNRQSQSSQTKVKHVAVPQTLGKISNVPVERFNPGPNRQSQSSQTTVKHLTSESAKFPQTPVERFNPGPNRQNKA